MLAVAPRRPASNKKRRRFRSEQLGVIFHDIEFANHRVRDPHASSRSISVHLGNLALPKPLSFHMPSWKRKNLECCEFNALARPRIFHNFIYSSKPFVLEAGGERTPGADARGSADLSSDRILGSSLLICGHPDPFVWHLVFKCVLELEGELFGRECQRTDARPSTSFVIWLQISFQLWATSPKTNLSNDGLMTSHFQDT